VLVAPRGQGGRLADIGARVRTQFFPRQVRRAISHVRRDRLTYLSSARLNRLAQLCLDHERAGVLGMIVEAGCALGGASIVMAASKALERKLAVHDVFGMIPAPSDEDGEDVKRRYEAIASGSSQGIGGDLYYGYVENLYARVELNFAEAGYDCATNNITLVPGLVQETLKIEDPVSLAHIDVDWYAPVWVCLARLEPKLSVGGSLVLDDYHDWSGCRRAADAYFAGRRLDNYRIDDRAGSLVVTKLQHAH
jgi:O-methyltransferase